VIEECRSRCWGGASLAAFLDASSCFSVAITWPDAGRCSRSSVAATIGRRSGSGATGLLVDSEQRRGQGEVIRGEEPTVLVRSNCVGRGGTSGSLLRREWEIRPISWMVQSFTHAASRRVVHIVLDLLDTRLAPSRQRQQLAPRGPQTVLHLFSMRQTVVSPCRRINTAQPVALGGRPLALPAAGWRVNAAATTVTACPLSDCGRSSPSRMANRTTGARPAGGRVQGTAIQHPSRDASRLPLRVLSPSPSTARARALALRLHAHQTALGGSRTRLCGAQIAETARAGGGARTARTAPCACRTPRPVVKSSVRALAYSACPTPAGNGAACRAPPIRHSRAWMSGPVPYLLGQHATVSGPARASHHVPSSCMSTNLGRRRRARSAHGSSPRAAVGGAMDDRPHGVEGSPFRLLRRSRRDYKRYPRRARVGEHAQLDRSP